MLPTTKLAMLEGWGHNRLPIKGFPERVEAANLKFIQPWAPWVFVGTDNVETRWLVQKTWPRHLVIAGTAGFMGMVSEHDRRRPCAGCLHAATEDVGGEVPTVSFVSYLAGLLGAARLLWWAAAGPADLADQAVEAWADRLDSPHGLRSIPVPRLRACPVSCERKDGPTS
jgi:hypothetical protein